VDNASPYDFRDRVAVITGATGGLGPAVARAFAAAGAGIVLLARNPEKLDSLAFALTVELGLPSERLLIRPTDLTDPDAVRAMAAEVVGRFGHVDVLANLVGGWEPGKVVTTSDERWHEVLVSNLYTVFYATRELVPHMREGGAIINVGNQIPVEGKGGQLAYGVAKSGVLTLTQSVAKELKNQGIRVNAVLPSNIDTPDNRRFRPNEDPALWPKPEEVARTMLFLASPDAKLISGALVPVYGRSW
jgi:NAD(P)-dependent dehydrogenase (short-subunit alcohol dehydrogenase family)